MSARTATWRIRCRPRHARPTLDPGTLAEASILRPVDVDAAADAARMAVALHERVERQLQAYEAAEGSVAGRYRAVGAIARALATHVAVEDELLYPALRATPATTPRSSASSSRTTCSTWSWSSSAGWSRPTGATTARCGC